MNSQFETISPFGITKNIFSMLDTDWMLVTPGIPEDYNTMTASWGGFGILWKKPVAYVFVRPQRYTYRFMEKYEYLSLGFFPAGYRDALNFCGTRSGKDVNKAAECGLTPIKLPGGGVAFGESELVMECTKKYFSDLNPAHIPDPAIHKLYPANDYHRMYICEISNVYRKIKS